MDKKSIYKNSTTTYQGILILLAILLVAVTAYLTSHYFSTIFPTGMATSGLCNVNDFFNCDIVTYSPLSNLFGVPIAIFGLCFSILILFSIIFYSKELEGTIYQLLKINGIGCLVLFFYSLLFLGGLCPFCTLYYVLSWITLFLFIKHSSIRSLSKRVLIIFSLCLLIVAGMTKYYVHGLEQDQGNLAADLIKQYDNLPNLGNPKFDSEYRLVSSTMKFSDAPIQITKFSDFECPACRMLSATLHKISKRYNNKINIQYFFYPLQMECNDNVKRPMHEYACKAAYVASCDPSHFSKIEEYIFTNQKDFSNAFFNQIIKKYNLSKCVEDPQTKEKVKKYIQAASPFNITSTPTFLLNGVKIEGVLPEAQLVILINHILEKNGK